MAFLVAAMSFAGPVAVFAVVGGLITSRGPKSIVGWLLVTVGLLFSVVVVFSSVGRWD